MKATPLLVAGLIGFALGAGLMAMRPRVVVPPIPKGFVRPCPDSPPFFDVDVMWGLNLDPDTQALYERLATILTGVTTTPKPRSTFWSALNGINGWRGGVTAVADNGKGGHRVTVKVDPNMGQMRALSSYSEQWDVDANGNPTFVQSFDPDGMAGKMPGIMID